MFLQQLYDDKLYFVVILSFAIFMLRRHKFSSSLRIISTTEKENQTKIEFRNTSDFAKII